MIRKYILLTILLFFIGHITIACGDSDQENALLVSSEDIITEKTFPAHFHEQAEQGVMIDKAIDQETFDELWKDFRLTEHPPEVEWNQQVAIFLGIYESGTCPYDISKMELNAEKTNLSIHLDIDSEMMACTDDATPRTFVIVVHQDDLSDVSVVQIRNYDGLEPSIEWHQQ